MWFNGALRIQIYTHLGSFVKQGIGPEQNRVEGALYA